MKVIARLLTILAALAGYYAAPIYAAAQYAFGGQLAKQRTSQAGVKADEMMAALLGSAHDWLSQVAANNDGYGWRLLAWLLETGWPGHIEQYKGK